MFFGCLNNKGKDKASDGAEKQLQANHRYLSMYPHQRHKIKRKLLLWLAHRYDNYLGYCIGGAMWWLFYFQNGWVAKVACVLTAWFWDAHQLIALMILGAISSILMYYVYGGQYLPGDKLSELCSCFVLVTLVTFSIKDIYIVLNWFSDRPLSIQVSKANSWCQCYKTFFFVAVDKAK
jgi:hypothetical protein